MLLHSPKSASRIFWCFAIVYGMVWTFLPFWFEPNFRYDIIEMFFIGKEGVIATFKHPALNSAILETVYQALGRSSVAPYFLAQIMFGATAWAVWRLGRELLPPQEALFGALAFYGYWGFFYKSLYYNHNVVLMPAWAFVTLFAFFALKNGRYHDWLALGIAIGIGVYCKYTILVLVAAILLFMVLNATARKHWRRPGPYLTTLAALAVAAPLIEWMIQSDFSGLKFPSTVYGLEKTLPNRLYAIFNDALTVPPLLAISFVVLLFPLFGFRLRFRQLDDDQRFGRNFLLGTHYLPWGFLVISCFTAAVPMEYGNYFQLLIFFGLILLTVFQTNQTPLKIRMTWLFIGLTMFGYILGYAMHVYHSYYVTQRDVLYMFPGRQLAEEAEKIWHEKYDKPLPYVAGGWWFAGNVAIYGKDRPTYHGKDHSLSLKDSAFPLDNWSTDQDVMKHGGLVFWKIWNEGDESPPPSVKEHFPSAVILPQTIHLKQKLGQMQQPLIGVAIIPPDDSIETKPFQPAPRRFR